MRVDAESGGTDVRGRANLQNQVPRVAVGSYRVKNRAFKLGEIILKFVNEYGYKLATKILKTQRKSIFSENLATENLENTPLVT